MTKPRNACNDVVHALLAQLVEHFHGKEVPTVHGWQRQGTQGHKPPAQRRQPVWTRGDTPSRTAARAAATPLASDCLLPPGHDADIAAQALGYEWEARDPMPDLVAPFYICAACVHEQAHRAHDEAIAAGYARPPLTCCAAGAARRKQQTDV